MQQEKPAVAWQRAERHVANIKYQDLSVVSPRDAASGLATGKRMHKPYRVADTDFDINTAAIYTSDGKLYAEVKTSKRSRKRNGNWSQNDCDRRCGWRWPG